MSLVVLFGAGAFIGLVAFSVVIIVTLLTEKPDSSTTERPSSKDGSVR